MPIEVTSVNSELHSIRSVTEYFGLKNGQIQVGNTFTSEELTIVITSNARLALAGHTGNIFALGPA